MTDTDDLSEFVAFELPGDDGNPADVALRMMAFPEHAHLLDNEIKFAYLMRVESKDKGGKRELGSVADVKHMAQGAFKDLFTQLLVEMVGFLPQFVMVLDREFWLQADDHQREALVFHELCHVRQALDKYGSPRFDLDGNPVYKIHEHDVTAFNSEVQRFGLWTNDLRAFAPIMRDAE